MLKKYETEQKKKAKDVFTLLFDDGDPTEVACTEKWCEGEMFYLKPYQNHLELKGLKRAICIYCGWKGWI